MDTTQTASNLYEEWTDQVQKKYGSTRLTNFTVGQLEELRESLRPVMASIKLLGVSDKDNLALHWFKRLPDEIRIARKKEKQKC